METYQSVVRKLKKPICVTKEVDRQNYHTPKDIFIQRITSLIENAGDVRIKTAMPALCREIACRWLHIGGVFSREQREPLVFLLAFAPKASKNLPQSVKALNELEKKHGFHQTRIFNISLLKKRFYNYGAQPTCVTEEEISSKDNYIVVASPKWRATSIHFLVFLLLLKLGCFYKMDHLHINKKQKRYSVSGDSQLMGYYLRMKRFNPHFIDFIMTRRAMLARIVTRRHVDIGSMYSFGPIEIIRAIKNYNTPLGNPYPLDSDYAVRVEMVRYINDHISEFAKSIINK